MKKKSNGIIIVVLIVIILILLGFILLFKTKTISLNLKKDIPTKEETKEIEIIGTYEQKSETESPYYSSIVEVTNKKDNSIDFKIDAAHGLDIDHINIGSVEGTATKTTKNTYIFKEKDSEITFEFSENKLKISEKYPDDTNPYGGHGVYFKGEYIKINNIKNNNANSITEENDNYNKIIEEYKTAMNDNEFESNPEKYPNINTTMMNYYHTYNSTKFKYTYYDINKDGKKELIIGDDAIYEIYTSDGNKFFDSNCLGDRCTAKIYDNGIIYFYGAGGASIHGLTFYKIGSNNNKEVIKDYSVETDSSGNATITDSKTNEKTNYTTDEEVISSVVGNAKVLDLSKLNLVEIK